MVQHHEPRHQAVPRQAGQQQAQQHPGGRIAHRQPEGQPRAGTAGDVAAVGHSGQGLDAGVAGGQQVARRAAQAGGAALRRFPPVQPGIDETAAADGDKRQRHDQHQPVPPMVAPLPAPPPRAGPDRTSKVPLTLDIGGDGRLGLLAAAGVLAMDVIDPGVVRTSRRPCSGSAPRGGTAPLLPRVLDDAFLPARCRCAGRTRWFTRHSGTTRVTKATTSQVQPQTSKTAKKTASPTLPSSRDPVRRLPRFFS